MAINSGIIFIKNSELSQLKTNLSFLQEIKMHFAVPFYHLPTRILLSLVPPLFGKKHQKIYVDLLGPFLALAIMTVLLHYGHAAKLPTSASKISPSVVLLMYAILMPVASYFLIRFGQSRISLVEIISILGYALYGHLFTLLISLIFYDEESNLFFFVCMLIFGGLSSLRIVVILVALIPKPALRLIVCSFVSIVQLLFLVFLHFLYMHRTFRYGRKNW